MCDNGHNLIKMTLIGSISLGAARPVSFGRNKPVFISPFFSFFFLIKENDFQLLKAHCPAPYWSLEQNT